MKLSQFERQEEIRKKHNKEIITRMIKGEDLHAYAPEDSWYPERPIIEKDQKIINNLKKDKNKKDDHAKTSKVLVLQPAS